MLSKEGADFNAILRRYDVEQQIAITPEILASKMLPNDEILRKVAEEVVYMRFKTIASTVLSALKERDALNVISKGLVTGMDCVAKLYAQHVYYLPEIIIAAKTMEIGMATAEQHVVGGREYRGKVVMHAVEGDPHDIGKNIAAVMLRSAGYKVIDLGRDVPIKLFVGCVTREKPLFASGTALMTTTMSAFPVESSMIMEKGLELPLMCCGGAVNREYVESFDLGIYSQRASQTPLIADKLREGYDWKRIREEWDSIVEGA